MLGYKRPDYWIINGIKRIESVKVTPNLFGCINSYTEVTESIALHFITVIDIPAIKYQDSLEAGDDQINNDQSDDPDDTIDQEPESQED